MAKAGIVCTVTNDLSFDQRMIRICSSLQQAGYQVTLVGRKRRMSVPLQTRTFAQKRLYCPFDKGLLFYAWYNIRLFFFLLFYPADIYCAIDLDTILPVWLASVLRKRKRVYDAHELFCEMDEITQRPTIYKIWKGIERFAVPKFTVGYTIGDCYADEFFRNYGVRYAVVRNATKLIPLDIPPKPEKYILYQGAVNEGRCFEQLIPAMKKVNIPLWVCGEGNYFQQALALTRELQIHHIRFTGYIEPEQLRSYTLQAACGITLFTKQGKSNYLSMANRFFDYMHAAVPQICVDFPEYRRVNEQFEIALLIPDTEPDTIAHALQRLFQDTALYQRLQNNCLRAREVYCWQQQETTLHEVYQKLLA